MAPLVLGLLRTATRGAWTTLYLRACAIVCLVASQPRSCGRAVLAEWSAEELQALDMQRTRSCRLSNPPVS